MLKPVTFDPYRRRRSRWAPPRWLVLLLVGLAAGVAGVIYVQERYLPPRLSADASAKLQTAFDGADAERTRLASELGATTKKLDTALADTKRLGDELAASRASTDRLRDDVAAIAAALPPDPRGAGGVEVRAGQFGVKGGMLTYDVVLTRGKPSAKPMPAVMQLVVTGDSAAGVEKAASLKPVNVSIGGVEVVRGSLPLPEGFRPRQTTIQVLDRVGGKALGMRVLLVK